MHTTLIPVAVLGGISSLLAAHAYLPSGTGVTGSAGALWVLLGAVSVTVGSIVVDRSGVRGTLFGLLVFLISVCAVLTALAGFFMTQYGLAVIMALAYLGLLLAVLTPARPLRLAR